MDEKKLLFVYNADSSIFAQVGDLIHKIISPKTYQCNLCGLTYSGMNMKQDWKDFINTLPFNVEFLHKDEFIKKYPKSANAQFPAAFIELDQTLGLIILADEINRQKTLEELKKLVLSKMSKQ